MEVEEPWRHRKKPNGDKELLITHVKMERSRSAINRKASASKSSVLFIYSSFQIYQGPMYNAVCTLDWEKSSIAIVKINVSLYM